MGAIVYHPKGSMCAVCVKQGFDCSMLDFEKMRPIKQYSHENDPTVFKVVLCEEFEQ